MHRGVGLVALAAIPAVVLGGFDSPGGAVVGGLIIGVVSVLCAGYQDELSFLGPRARQRSRPTW